jgi:hypothetical protein
MLAAGTKWTATKWVHIHPFGVAPPPEDPQCMDLHQQCAEWAFFEECNKTPKYMHVNCRKSCKLCTPFAAEASTAAAAVEPQVVSVGMVQGGSSSVVAAQR